MRQEVFCVPLAIRAGAVQPIFQVGERVRVNILHLAHGERRAVVVRVTTFVRWRYDDLRLKLVEYAGEAPDQLRQMLVNILIDETEANALFTLNSDQLQRSV